MTMLSAAEIAAHKSAAEASFNDTCSILQWAAGTDSGGHYKDTWPTTASGVSCGFKPEQAYSQDEGRLVIIAGKAKLRLSLTQSLNIKDRITVRGATWDIGNIVNGSTVKLVSLEMAKVNDG